MTLYPQDAEPAKPRLTEREVLRIASEFCKKLVRNAGASPEKYRFALEGKPAFDAQRNLPEGRSPLPFGEFWKLVLKSGVELNVQDRSGLVVWVYAQGSQFPKATLSPSQEKALVVRASAYKPLFWPKSDLFSTEHSIGGMRNTDRFGTGSLTFSYDWQRRFRGIPYKDQALSVSLDTTGNLISGILRHWTPEPKNFVEKIDEARAREIALQTVKTEYEPLAERPKCVKMVVEKNRFWTKVDVGVFVGAQHGSASPILERSYIAWVVTVPIRASGPAWAVVGVDAESGEVLSGEIFQTRG